MPNTGMRTEAVVTYGELASIHALGAKFAA